MELKKFSDYPYTRPDIPGMLKEYDAITSAMGQAGSAEEQLALFAQHEKLYSSFVTADAACYIRHTVDTTDKRYEEEYTYMLENEPFVEEKVQGFYKALLDSRFRPQLEEKLGSLLFTNLEIASRAFSPSVVPMLQEENRLQSDYQKLVASAQIPFNGKTLTLAQLGAYKENPDRRLRRQAYEAEGQFYEERQEQFDQIFDDLVQVRTRIAKALGLDSFTKVGYLRRGRNCYGIEQVEAFREQVAQDLVPIVGQIRQNQARRIGIASLTFYDDLFVFPDGNAHPTGTPDEIMAAGKRMYEEMGAETGRFIHFMMEHGLFDCVATKGKAAGGYCTYLPDLKAPFIFSNFNGTSGDVDVLTHEAGHAFAAFEAEKATDILELRDPTMESCEVHSMSMEFLAEPWYPLFFGPMAGKYTLSHLEDALKFIPYGCMVDEFQHIVYDQPQLTPDQRREAWLSLERKYRPELDFGGLPFYGKGSGWQRQSHIYLSPFYYIDYTFAQITALQIWQTAQRSHDEAWGQYRAFMSGAGTKTFVGLLETAGLKTPFEPGLVKSVADSAAQWIAAHPYKA